MKQELSAYFADFQIPNPKFQIPNSKSQIPNSKFQIPNSKFQIPNPKFQINNHQSPIERSATYVASAKMGLGAPGFFHRAQSTENLALLEFLIPNY